MPCGHCFTQVTMGFATHEDAGTKTLLHAHAVSQQKSLLDQSSADVTEW